MRGKLVAQDENDEPANELLEKIAQEKAQLIKEKKIKKTKPLPEITDEEKPFDIPDSWEWVRLGDLVDNSVSYPMADGPFGSNLKKEHYTSNAEVRIIQLSNIGEKGWKNKNTKYTTFEHLKEIERSAVQAGDIVIAKMMPAGRAIEVPGEDKGYVLSSDAVKFVPNRSIDKNFILKDINSPVFQKQVSAHLQGSTRPRTSLKKLKSYLLPLPPLNEQKRIAAKVEELFELLDIIGESTNNYETLQKELKEKILELGMQGKLVEQDIGDESASKLYEQIQAEKAQLIKEKKIKKTKPLPEITDEEKPFNIPDSWKWVRIGSIGDVQTGNTPSKKDSSLYNGNIPFIKPANISKNGINYNTEEYLTTDGVKKGRIANRGAILITCIGNLGRNFYIDRKVAFNQQINSIYPFFVTSELLHYFLESKFFVSTMYRDASATTLPILNKSKLSNLLLPLPPLNEQKRIATKIEELFNTIDN